MAVYPNRIVQKDTTDATSTALTAIASGTESVVVGELVVNRVSNEVFLLTKYSNTVAKVVSAPAPLGNRGDITVTGDGYTWTVNAGAITDAKFTGPLSIAKGGTGTTTANGALNAFLPTQVNNAGKALLTDGVNTYWAAQVPLTGTLNDVLKWTGSGWSSTSFSSFTIDELGDVDTSTKPPIKNQSLTWDGSRWVPGVSATRIGRGDGGDFDTGQVEAAFVFAVWGGGDFDATTEDKPIEIARKSVVDGCEIVSDYTAVLPTTGSISVAAGAPAVAIGIAVIIPAEKQISIVPQEILSVGQKAYLEVAASTEVVIAVPNTPLILAGAEDTYFSDFGIQTYRWDSDIMVDWWAE